MRATAVAGGSTRRNPPGILSHRAPRRWPTGRGATTLLVTTSLMIAVTMTVSQLVSDSPGRGAPPVRPLSTDEAVRLATMRQVNWTDARAGVSATIGAGSGRVHAAGWIDWHRPMAYLILSGAEPGLVTGLVQAAPGLVATRDARLPRVDSPLLSPDGVTRLGNADPLPRPPTDIPPDGWRLRPAGADRGPSATVPVTVDALVELLFSLAAPRSDAADRLAGSGARWLRHDHARGYEVDVLQGPASPPAAGRHDPTAPESAPHRQPDGSPAGTDGSSAGTDGTLRYWIDDQARLHRVEGVLAGVPARVDLDRDDRTGFPALDLLGGARVRPRPVTTREASLLSQVRLRNRSAGGAAVTVTIPTTTGGTARASGWIDWARTVAYLALRDSGQPGSGQPGTGQPGSGVLWADRTGVATRPPDHRAGDPPRDGPAGDLRSAPAVGAAAGPGTAPPLPAPQGGWTRQPWHQRGDRYGGWDLDLLIHEALSFASWVPDDPARLVATAVWLRDDELAGDPVSVFEIPRPVEADLRGGQARLRYWVDDESGQLRRLEIRTRSGGFGQLDLEPGPVPYLGVTP